MEQETVAAKTNNGMLLQKRKNHEWKIWETLYFQWGKGDAQEIHVNKPPRKTDQSTKYCVISSTQKKEARCGHVTICKIRLWYAMRSFPRQFFAHGSEMRAYSEIRKRKARYIIMKEFEQKPSCMPMGENGYPEAWDFQKKVGEFQKKLKKA